MSESLYIDAFYRSSTQLEPAVEFLVESSIAELSLDSNLLSEGRNIWSTKQSPYTWQG